MNATLKNELSRFEVRECCRTAERRVPEVPEISDCLRCTALRIWLLGKIDYHKAEERMRAAMVDP